MNLKTISTTKILIVSKNEKTNWEELLIDFINLLKGKIMPYEDIYLDDDSEFIISEVDSGKGGLISFAKFINQNYSEIESSFNDFKDKYKITDLALISVSYKLNEDLRCDSLFYSNKNNKKSYAEGIVKEEQLNGIKKLQGFMNFEEDDFNLRDFLHNIYHMHYEAKKIIKDNLQRYQLIAENIIPDDNE